MTPAHRGGGCEVVVTRPEHFGNSTDRHDLRTRLVGAPTTIDTVQTLCAYCGVGCGITLELSTNPVTGRPQARKAVGTKDQPTSTTVKR